MPEQGFADMHYISELATLVEELLIEKNGKNLSAQEITEKLWENMIIQTKKAGQMFRDDIPAWDDISIGVINSPPLI